MQQTYFSRLLAIVILFWVAFPSAGQELQIGNPEQLGVSTERLSKLTQSLDEFVNSGRLPGTVTIILKNGKVIFEHANGMRDIEAQDAMETTDLFRIASQTKAIISAGILLLQEDGKLIVTAPASRYLPEFAKLLWPFPTVTGTTWWTPAGRSLSATYSPTLLESDMGTGRPLTNGRRQKYKVGTLRIAKNPFEKQ
jgi:CubicO group peptidase (beta-lactamase class C family)